MKLIIQIPCYNEDKTLRIALDDLPRHIDGIDEIEYLIINDGSRDNTVKVAKDWGVHYVVNFRRNKGLAYGFMAGLEADQLDKLSLLTTGEYEISERMTLDITFHEPEGDTVHTALNEVSARSGSFRICDFEVYSEDYLVGKYRADGVLFSTPSGSTAYALSAGGPVVEPDLECIEMTLICPHSLFSRATLFSPWRNLRLTNKTSGDECMVINVDGELHFRLHEEQSIEIKRGQHNIKFINLIGNSFHESVCRKLCRPIK